MSYVEDIQDGVLRRCIGAPDEKLKISTNAAIIGSSAFYLKAHRVPKGHANGGCLQLPPWRASSCREYWNRRDSLHIEKEIP